MSEDVEETGELTGQSLVDHLDYLIDAVPFMERPDSVESPILEWDMEHDKIVEDLTAIRTVVAEFFGLNPSPAEHQSEKRGFKVTRIP